MEWVVFLYCSTNMLPKVLFLLFMALCASPVSMESCLCEDKKCLDSSKQIELEGVECTLQVDFVLSNKKNVTILGVNNISTIKCLQGAALAFNNITNLAIWNIKFNNCGEQYAAVSMVDCVNVSLWNVSIVDSDGTGLAMQNVFGDVQVVNCNFNGNVRSFDSTTSGGGGMYIEFDLSEEQNEGSYDCKSAKYNITKCSFINNAVNISDAGDDCNDRSGIGRGGALYVSLMKNPCHVEIAIDTSTMENNFAQWGGAMELVCQGENNNITISNTNISSNSVLNNNTIESYVQEGCGGGGGGVDVYFLDLGTHNNNITLLNVTFMNNQAYYGGGVLITSHYAYDQSNNNIVFLNCSWEKNSAHYASAVDVYPDKTLDGWYQRPNVTFVDCEFCHNRYRNALVKENIYRNGEGVVMVTGFTTNFKGRVRFVENSGSSIYAISSQISFDGNADVLFEGNRAEKGAGMALIGLSVISVGNNTNIVFQNNTVTKHGAALYYKSTDKHVYVHKKRCFIQKLNKEVSNVSFYFSGNKAPKDPFYVGGHYMNNSIHTSTSISACLDDCNFDGVCNITFNFSEDRLTTAEKDYTSKESDVSFIPGQMSKLPLSNSVNTSFDLSMENKATNVRVIDSHHTIQNNNLMVFGTPGDAAEITLTERGNRKYFLKFTLKIKDCPPLLKLVNGNCLCYNSSDTYYVAFFVCYSKWKQPHLRVGFWIGYAETSEQDINKTLYISYCPNSYCNENVGEKENYYPIKEESKELETAVCSANRRGILCGECTENTTVYFYSRNFKCGSTENCNLGPLLYLLSEILPLTIIFILVIVFNISFTSGGLSGFIFFAQMYDSIDDVGDNFLVKNSGLKGVHTIPQFVYRSLNLDFFGINETSFCLWEKANTLSILTFKYLTVLYALFLVLATVLFMRCVRVFKCIRLRKLKYSVIQGLSAFLIMAYSQCTEISFSILNPINIYNGPEKNSTVVFLQGNVHYFSSEHRPYAIPALFCIVSFVLTVPLLLMCYPQCNKVITYLRLDENRGIQLISGVIPMYKIKPFLDCFQGTFKDKCRYFAGLYFVYRATILASRFAPTILTIYIVMELQFTLMLILHTLCWPYQKTIHNVIDTLLIANLAIITMVRMLINIETENPTLYTFIFITYPIEFALVSIPVVTVSAFAVYKVIQQVKPWFKRNNFIQRDSKFIDPMFLEGDARERSLNRSTDSYMLMRERVTQD